MIVTFVNKDERADYKVNPQQAIRDTMVIIYGVDGENIEPYIYSTNRQCMVGVDLSYQDNLIFNGDILIIPHGGEIQ